MNERELLNKVLKLCDGLIKERDDFGSDEEKFNSERGKELKNSCDKCINEINAYIENPTIDNATIGSIKKYMMHYSNNPNQLWKFLREIEELKKICKDRNIVIDNHLHKLRDIQI